MKLRPLTWLIPLAVCAVVLCMVLAGISTSEEAASPQNAAALSQTEQELSILSGKNSTSYEPLSFNEMFVLPAGPKGLEFTPKIKALNGKKICITGHMIRHADIDTSAFLFCETPRAYNEREEGLADSIPPQMLYVILPVRAQDAPAWRREKMTLYGTLELGSRQELSGRVSHMRLRCDAITDAQTGAPLEVRKPVALQSARAVPPSGDVGALPRSDMPAPFFNPRRNQDSNLNSSIP